MPASEANRDRYIEDHRENAGSDHGPILGGGLKVAITRHVFFRAELFEILAMGRTRWGWNSASMRIDICYLGSEAGA